MQLAQAARGQLVQRAHHLGGDIERIGPGVAPTLAVWRALTGDQLPCRQQLGQGLLQERQTHRDLAPDLKQRGPVQSGLADRKLDQRGDGRKRRRGFRSGRQAVQRRPAGRKRS